MKGSKIHVMGVAYKRDIDDMRESPALDVMLLLKRRGGLVTYSDPHVPVLKVEGLELAAMPEDSAASADCVVDRNGPFLLSIIPAWWNARL